MTIVDITTKKGIGGADGTRSQVQVSLRHFVPRASWLATPSPSLLLSPNYPRPVYTKSLPRNKSLSGFLAGPTGLGPATSAVTVQRSNQAELRPHKCSHYVISIRINNQ